MDHTAYFEYQQQVVEEKLAEVRARHPGWDIFPVFGGWLARPAGTVLVQSTDLDGIDGKISVIEQDQGL